MYAYAYAASQQVDPAFAGSARALHCWHSQLPVPTPSTEHYYLFLYTYYIHCGRREGIRGFSFCRHYNPRYAMQTLHLILRMCWGRRVYIL